MKVSQGRNPGRNEKAGSGAEAMVKHCLLACSTFLTSLQTTSPGMAARNSLEHSTKRVNEENASQICLQANVIVAFFSTNVPSSQFTLPFVKLKTNKKRHQHLGYPMHMTTLFFDMNVGDPSSGPTLSQQVPY